jgi:hypothetical protein
MSLNSRTRPTLIRSGGMHLDTAREVAIEAGYLPADNLDSPNRSDLPMLLDHIAEEASGRKVYRPGDGAALAINADEAKALRAHEERVSRARDAVSGTLEDTGERLSRDGSRAVGRRRPVWRLSQTTVCERVLRSREILGKNLSIPCCRMALKGK